MKKTLLSILFVLTFLLSNFSGLGSTVFAQSGIEVPFLPDGGSQTWSSRCEQVLTEAVQTDTSSNTNVGPNDIIVILSESIQKNDSEYTCSEIVSCLRQRYRGKTGSEALVTADLKTNYNFCIVSGKDGLDLLSNYANLVYTWIAGIVGAICILVIILSGIQISIGGLSQEEVSTAKDRVVRALVGLAVLFLSAFILYTINPFFFT